MPGGPGPMPGGPAPMMPPPPPQPGQLQAGKAKFPLVPFLLALLVPLVVGLVIGLLIGGGGKASKEDEVKLEQLRAENKLLVDNYNEIAKQIKALDPEFKLPGGDKLAYSDASKSAKKSDSKKSDKKGEAKTDNTAAPEQKDIYNVGDTWQHANDWQLTVKGAEIIPGEEKKEYFVLDGKVPKYLVKIVYTYKNLEYTDKVLGPEKAIMPSALEVKGGPTLDDMACIEDMNMQAKSLKPGESTDDVVCYFPLEEKPASAVLVFNVYDSQGEEATAKYQLNFN